MRRITPFILSLLLLAAVQETDAQNRWQELTYMRTATHLAVEGNALWVGTLSGVYRLNIDTGRIRAYNRANDGLADNTILDLTIDAGGRVWVATPEGLSGFDGTEWKTFNTGNSGLTSNFITALAADPGGGLWVGTFDAGLFFFDRQNWTHYDVGTTGLSDRFVTSIRVGTDGAVWVGAWGNGVDRFDHTGWQNFTPGNSGLLSSFVYVRTVDKRTGDVWFWCSDDDQSPDVGMVRFDGTAWSPLLTGTTGILSDYTGGLDVAPDGSLAFGTVAGLSLFDGTVWHTFPDVVGTFDFNFSNTRNLIAHPDRDLLWIGTGNGVLQYDGQTFTPLPVPGPAGTDYRDLAVAEDSTLWVLSQAGVERLTPAGWELMTLENSPVPRSNRVADLVLDAAGALWVATTERGLMQHQAGVWTVFNTANSPLPDNRVQAVAVDDQDRLWVASGTRHVSRFDGTAWTHFTLENVQRIFASRFDGQVWAFAGGAVHRLDDGQWTPFTVTDGLIDPRVRTAGFSQQGEVWFGTQGGLSRFDGATWTSFTTADSLAGNWINSVVVDAQGLVWVGTQFGGASRFDGRRWTPIRRSDGLIDSRILSVTVDAENRKWFGGVLGISILTDLLVSPANTDSETPHRFAAGYNYPNPFTESTTLVFETARPGPVHLQVYNLLGQEVYAEARGPAPAGAQRLDIAGGGWAPGVYLYRIATGGGIVTGRMVKQ